MFKPLTTTSAVLTFVSTQLILEVDKQLMMQTDKAFAVDEDSSDREQNTENWQGLMTKLCQNKLPQFKQIKNTGIYT